MIYKVKNDRELAVYWNGHLIYHKKLKTGGDWLVFKYYPVWPTTEMSNKFTFYPQYEGQLLPRSGLHMPSAS
jgi:hypothetical protein